MKLSGVLAVLRRPISTRFRVRWSTIVMAIVFLGLGSLWLEVKTSPSAASAANTSRAIDHVGRRSRTRGEHHDHPHRDDDDDHDRSHHDDRPARSAGTPDLAGAVSNDVPDPPDGHHSLSHDRPAPQRDNVDFGPRRRPRDQRHHAPVGDEHLVARVSRPPYGPSVCPSPGGRVRSVSHGVAGPAALRLARPDGPACRTRPTV